MNKGKIIQIESRDEEARRVLTSCAAAVALPLCATDLATVAALEQTLLQLGGVGLAAPQLGISRRIAAVWIPESAVVMRRAAEPQPMYTILQSEELGRIYPSSSDTCSLWRLSTWP